MEDGLRFVSVAKHLLILQKIVVLGCSIGVFALIADQITEM